MCYGSRMPRRSSRGGAQRQAPKVRAALCATCLVDQFFPEVGEAVVAVLRRAGVEVSFPAEQTCCGQVAFNGGYEQEAREAALRFLDVFDGGDHVVVPSGSCASMMKVFYLELFEHDPALLERARNLSERTHEFTEFMANVVGDTAAAKGFEGKVTYHDACHALRELRISQEPRALLERAGAEVVEMQDSDRCCGFGGLFSVKYPHISTAILEEKLANIEATEADAVATTDCGCLMHIRGAMSRKGMRQRALHVAEALAAANGEGGG